MGSGPRGQGRAGRSPLRASRSVGHCRPRPRASSTADRPAPLPATGERRSARRCAHAVGQGGGAGAAGGGGARRAHQAGRREAWARAGRRAGGRAWGTVRALPANAWRALVRSLASLPHGSPPCPLPPPHPAVRCSCASAWCTAWPSPAARRAPCGWACSRTAATGCTGALGCTCVRVGCVLAQAWQRPYSIPTVMMQPQYGDLPSLAPQPPPSAPCAPQAAGLQPPAAAGCSVPSRGPRARRVGRPRPQEQAARGRLGAQDQA